MRSQTYSRMLMLLLGALTAALVLTAPRGVRASNQSIVTLGFGVDFGLLRYVGSGTDFEETVAAEVSARARLFRIFAVAFSYNPIPAEGGELGLGASFRLTGFFYMVPTRWFSLYLLGGLGSRDITELFDVEGDGSTFHAGAGLEIYLGRHFAINVEYHWLIPGVSTIRGHAEQTASEVETSVTEAYESGGAIPIALPVLPETDVWDCFDGGNFQINIGIRYYL